MAVVYLYGEVLHKKREQGIYMDNQQGVPPPQPSWNQQTFPQQPFPQQSPWNPSSFPEDGPPHQPFPQQSWWDQPTQPHAALPQQPTGNQPPLPSSVPPRRPRRPLVRYPLIAISLVGVVVLLIGGITSCISLLSHSQTVPIKHIVFFIKENRTFDNYFGTYPGANGTTTAMDSEGKVVPLQHEAHGAVHDRRGQWKPADCLMDCDTCQSQRARTCECVRWRELDGADAQFADAGTGLVIDGGVPYMG